MIEASALTGIDTIRHGFFTREGGVSTGIYASLNCGLGSNDDPDAVVQNRALNAERLCVAPGALVTAYQIHGVTVAEVDEPWEGRNGPRADAMVTKRRGVALGILTADCAPVLLADARAGVIGAAHAGWKGAKTGVIAEVVAAMVGLGAEQPNIVAAVGPCIGLGSYEVGDEFRDAFLSDDPGAARFFDFGGGGKPFFDLPGFVVNQLNALGLGKVDRVDADTYAAPDRFFSYRRSCHRAEPDYGRQLSAIALA